MEHLFISAVRVDRLQLSVTDGRPSMTWMPSPEKGAGFLKCRLDLTFVRPGKDQPAAENAGRAPDRVGVMFCGPYSPIKAGDRIVAIPNEYGQTPVQGTFEIRVIPDLALNYNSAHHIEVQILETNQTLLDRFPDDDDEDLL